MPTCFIMAPKTPVWFGSSPSCEKELPRRARVFTWKRSHEISIESPRSCIKLQTLTLDRYPQTKDGSKTHHVSKLNIFERFFRTCQVRLLDFMSVACSSPPLLSSSPLLLSSPPLLSSSSCSTATLDAHCPAGPQPRPSPPSVLDLNHDHLRPVFPAGPQPRVSTPSVPCRTSCRKQKKVRKNVR